MAFPVGAAVSAGSAIGGGIYGTYNIWNQEALQQTPTSLQNISAFTTRSLADRLGSGTGLSDTAYNRYLDTAQSGAQRLRASGQETVRGSMMKSAVADRMLKEIFRSSSAAESSALRDVTLRDIEAAERATSQAIQAEMAAGARADKIAEIDRFNIKQKEIMKERKIDSVLRLFLGVGQQLGSASQQFGDYIDERRAFAGDDFSDTTSYDQIAESEMSEEELARSLESDEDLFDTETQSIFDEYGGGFDDEFGDL